MKSDRKTILLFSDWYLPGYKGGGPITSCANMIEYLGDDFNFKVVCGDRDYLETDPYSGVKSNDWMKVGKAQVIYLSPERQSLSNIKKIIKDVKADIAYLNGMFSKAFTIFPLIALRTEMTKVVVAPRGMLAPSAMGIRSFKKKTFLKLAKLFGLFSNVKFHATNSVESQQISAWFGEVPIEIVANIPGRQSEENIRSAHKKEKNKLRLISVARIAPEKNVHFALECLKGIESDISVNFEIIGAVYDEDYYNRCGNIIESLPVNVNVSFLETMPNKDIPGYSANADFFFLPTLGENYGHAIVEALLIGLPVVISVRTPWRNLVNARLGFDLDLKHKEFAQVLNELGKLSNQEYESKYKNVRTNAQALINLDKLQIGYKNLFDGRNRS